MKNLSPKSVKIILTVSGLLFVTLIIIGIIQAIYFRTYSAVLQVVYTPMSAAVTVDGENVTVEEYRVKPGEHVVRVSKEGFDAQEQRIEVNADENKKVYFILEPNSPSTMNWYAEHEEDGIKREAISGELLTESSENIQEKYPAVSFLPYETAAYSIGYGACSYDMNKVCMKFTTERPSGIWSVAIKRFTQLDKELGKYNYEFINYTNPFTIIKESSSLGDASNALLEMLSCVDGNYSIKNVEEINNYTVAYLTYSGNNYPVGTDLYRVVLSYDNGQWSIILPPILVISYSEYPDISKDIIDKINSVF